ncbi:MAG: T9SS type A sorting domain-containing protein [Bacteroidales bacterium]|nr:T9SS type A sorting domain-containing protein [Bacteroidales bacterium]
MKQISIIILFSFTISCIASAQDNIQYFAEEGTIWNIGMFGINPTCPTETYSYQMRGDTTIGAYNYHKIWLLSNSILQIAEDELVLLVRVSSTKIMYLRKLDGEEEIVFDFNLDYYDTFSFYSFWANHFIAVEGYVDNCEFQDFFGIQRKVWELGCENYSSPVNCWIEGIGPSEGILRANESLNEMCGSFMSLLCAWLDGEQIYQNPDFSYCESYIPTHKDRINLLSGYSDYWTIANFDSNDDFAYTDIINKGNKNVNFQYDELAYYYTYYYYYMRFEEFNIVDSTITNNSYLAQIYTDSLLIVKNSLDEAHVIFDFKAKVNDTLDLWSYNAYDDTFMPLTAWIENTDSINLLERKVKSWKLVNEYGSTIWMEGLGCDEGLLKMNCRLTNDTTFRTELQCSYLENLQVYQNPSFEFCYYIPTVNSIPSEPQNSTNTKLGTYPNPFTNSFTIGQIEGNYTVTIYNSFGAKILHVESDKPECQIQLNGFNAGIYYLRIITDIGNTTTKIVKL